MIRVTELSTEDFERMFVNLEQPTYAAEADLPTRFAAFHEANPQVADALEWLIGQWLARGHKRVGMKAVAERARWESGLAMPGEVWKINNSYVAFYARLMIERHPEWGECIETRVQKSLLGRAA